MEERKPPPVQRGSIDGVKARRPDVEKQPAGNNPQTSASQPAQEQAATPKDQQIKKTAEKKPKKSKNLMVIIPAVIVFIGLSSLAVYVNRQQNSDNQPAQQGAVSGQAPATEDSSQLIDQTINEIDQLSDQSDSSGEGLSNEKLGL